MEPHIFPAGALCCPTPLRRALQPLPPALHRLRLHPLPLFFRSGFLQFPEACPARFHPHKVISSSSTALYPQQGTILLFIFSRKCSIWLYAYYNGNVPFWILSLLIGFCSFRTSHFKKGCAALSASMQAAPHQRIKFFELPHSVAR